MGDLVALAPRAVQGALGGPIVAFVRPIAHGFNPYDPLWEAGLMVYEGIAAIALSELYFGASLPGAEWQVGDDDWTSTSVEVGALNTEADPEGDLLWNGFHNAGLGPNTEGHPGGTNRYETWWKKNPDGTWEERIHMLGSWRGYKWSNSSTSIFSKPWPTRFDAQKRDRRQLAQENAARIARSNGDMRIGTDNRGNAIWARPAIPRNLVPGVPFYACR